jgi:hypothetical protein
MWRDKKMLGLRDMINAMNNGSNCGRKIIKEGRRASVKIIFIIVDDVKI